MKTKRWTIFFLIAGLFGASFLIIVEAGQAKKNDRQAEAALQAADNKAFVDGDLNAAIGQYNKILVRFAASRAIAARALIRMGEAQEKLRNKEAQKNYERVVLEYQDQPTVVADAQAHLKALSSASASSGARAHRGLERLLTGGSWNSETHGRYLFGVSVIHDLLTGEEEPIGIGAPRPHSLVPSRDGKQVAFSSGTKTGDDLLIAFLKTGDASQERVLLHNEKLDYNHPFGWSPDEKEVYALQSLKDNTWRIAAVPASGPPRILKSLEWRKPNGLSVSPDGRYIAYDSPVAKNYTRDRDIVMLAVDGSSEQTVVQNPARNEKPLWTPDGKAVVFTSDRNGSLGLWSTQVSNGKAQGEPQLLRTLDVDSVDPLWFASDGSYYYRTTPLPKTDLSIRTIDLDAGTISGQKSIEQVAGRIYGFSYSPDGQKLAFGSDRRFGNFLSIMVRTLAGEKFEIPTMFTSMDALTWFPDGQSLLLRADDGANGLRLHRIDLKGEDLMKEKVDGRYPAVSPDAKKIYYARAENGEVRLMAYELETKRETGLFHGQMPARGNARFVLSPDGREIAFVLVDKKSPTLTDPGAQTTAPPVLRVVPTVGGPVRSLRSPDTLELNAIQWSPDSKRVLVQRGGGTIYWVPADGGESTKVNIDQAPGRVFGQTAIPLIDSMRPDGKEFAETTVSTAPPEIWVDPDLLRSNPPNPPNPSEAGNAGIYVAPFDPVTGRIRGPAQLLVDKSRGDACAPSWSPDGNSISFFLRGPVKEETYPNHWVIRSIQSGQERPFGTISTPCDVSGLWFHDSNSLLGRASFLRRGDRLERLNLNSEEHPFLDFVAYNSATALSLDDKTLYMTAHDPKTRITSIVAADLASREQKRVWGSPFPSDTENLVPLRLALSSDGRTFALVLSDSKKVHLIRVGVDGAGFKEIYTADSTGSTPSRSGLAWSKDGRFLLFMDVGKSEQRLMRIPADGGKPEFTGLTIGTATDEVFDLSPDGRQIVFHSPRTPTIALTTARLPNQTGTAK